MHNFRTIERVFCKSLTSHPVYHKICYGLFCVFVNKLYLFKRMQVWSWDNISALLSPITSTVIMSNNNKVVRDLPIQKDVVKNIEQTLHMNIVTLY